MGLCGPVQGLLYPDPLLELSTLTIRSNMSYPWSQIWCKNFAKRFYVLLTVHLSIWFVNKPTWCTVFSYIFIYILYMFRAVLCPSSRELIVSMRHLVYVTMCRWPSGMQVGMKLMKLNSDLHTRRSSTQSDIYQVTHWFNWFSWWWAHSCPKHVENRNKYIRKIVHQVGLFTKIA